MWLYLGLALAMVLLGALMALGLVRMSDALADRRWQRAVSKPRPVIQTYDPEMVAHLPEPVRRYFDFAIAPGTPLYTHVALKMEGELGLGNQQEPRYFPYHARQWIDAKGRFLWRLKGRMRGVPVSGSDSDDWTRFRLGGLFPVARAGGTPDHRLSAFGRYMSETVLWLPTALLPSRHVHWTAPSENVAEAHITHADRSLSMRVTLDAQGKPLRVVFQRWSDANADKTFCWQCFGGRALAWRKVQGVQIATEVEAGHFFGTEAYFPFFKACITSAELF